MSERTRQCPRCNSVITFRSQVNEAEIHDSFGRAPLLYLRCPTCSFLLVMESGKLGQVGAALLIYERCKVLPALGSLLTIGGIIAAVITANVTTSDHVSFKISLSCVI